MNAFNSFNFSKKEEAAIFSSFVCQESKFVWNFPSLWTRFFAANRVTKFEFCKIPNKNRVTKFQFLLNTNKNRVA
jgi:ABC-type Mn2+/Zn2+ transport system ATPase subunit